MPSTPNPDDSVSWTVTPSRDLHVVEGGRGTFAGRPDGRPVEAVLPLDGQRAAILLIDPNDAADSNILRVQPDGRIEWYARLAHQSPRHDGYTSIWRDGDKLFAFSGYGFRVELDRDTGSVLSSQWEK